MQRFIRGCTCLGLLASLAACGAGHQAPDTTGPAPKQSAITHAESDREPDARRNPTAGRAGGLPDGVASCVETYSPEAVTGRAFAFDGVVVDIGDSVSDRGDGADLGSPGVTFEVGEWFSGGSADTVTVDVQVPNAESADAGYSYGIGSRLLVSGEARWGGAPLDAPIAWGCGFTRYYDGDAAEAWQDAFAR